MQQIKIPAAVLGLLLMRLGHKELNLTSTVILKEDENNFKLYTQQPGEAEQVLKASYPKELIQPENISPG